MKFNNLEEKCLFYRGLTDYRLMGNEYMIIMLDGHSFSKKIKKSFKLPFDDDFIGMMNETAEYVCQNVQGAKLAFVQSDEISVLVTDFDTPETDSFFGNRLCKIQSIVASLATSKFNQLMMLRTLRGSQYGDDAVKNIEEGTLYEFDCKAWTVPNANEAFSWFLYRQNDCIRNSKQQAAQTWLSHKELMNHTTDEQIDILKEKKGIDWDTEFDDGKKYGRLIMKRPSKYFNTTFNTEYERMEWTHEACPVLNDFDERKNFMNYFPTND